jgi:ribosomal protein S3
VNFLLQGLNLFLKRKRVKKNKMGQKTNPNIFQLSKTSKWDSKYIEKKTKDFYLHTSRDLEIKKFIFKFFKDEGLAVQSCKISYLNNNLNVFVSYHQKIKSIAVINKINKFQKIKVKFFIKNPKRKISPSNSSQYNLLKKKRWHKTSNIIKTIKNCFNYENLSCKKSHTGRGVSTNKQKLKRIKLIKYYKKYLSLKINKNIKNLSNNTFLIKLFQSINLFFNKKLALTLILKPLDVTTNKKLSTQKQEMLQKELVKLQKYKRNDFFKEGINLIFISVTSKNSAELISNYIALNFKKLKKHSFFLKFITTLLTIFISKTSFKIVRGIKLKIKGRLNGAPRAKSQTIHIGSSMSLLTIDSAINFSESTAYTSNGTIGIKVWVCEKN